MQVSPFAIFASFLLLAAPTFAQTTNLSSPPLDAAVTPDTQQKLKESLEKNRFKNVVVIPNDIIRAQAPDGSKIMIEITPDHVTGVVVGSGSTADQKPMPSPRSGGDF